MSAKYILKKIKDPDNPEHDITNVSIEFETCELSKVLECMEDFLRASGYTIKGNLIIEDEE